MLDWLNPIEWFKNIYGYTGHFGFVGVSVVVLFGLWIMWASGVKKWKDDNPSSAVVAVARLEFTNPEFAFMNVYITNDRPDDKFTVQAKIISGIKTPPRAGIPFSLPWIDHPEVSRPLRHGESGTVRLGDVTQIGQEWQLDFQLYNGAAPDRTGRSIYGNFTAK